MQRLYYTLIVLVIAVSITNVAQGQVSNTESIRYLALGDSYTIGQGVIVLSEKFPFHLAARLEADGIPVDTTMLVAQSGWRSDVLLNALSNANLIDTFELVTLLIGVNNFAQNSPLASYKSDLRMLIDSAIAFAGGRKDRVIVLSIPDYGFTPAGQANQEAISNGIERFNDVNRIICENAGVTRIDITPISQEGLADPALVSPDGLHPSGLQYRKWVSLMYPIVLGRLKADGIQVGW